MVISISNGKDAENKRVLQFLPGSTSGSSVFSGGSCDKSYEIIHQNSSSNEIYASDIGKKKVELWTIGASVATVTVNEKSGNITSFRELGSVILSPYGNIYVADCGNTKVKRYCVGKSKCDIVIDGESSPKLDELRRIAFDSNFNLYVTNNVPDAVYKYQRIRFIECLLFIIFMWFGKRTKNSVSRRFMIQSID